MNVVRKIGCWFTHHCYYDLGSIQVYNTYLERTVDQPRIFCAKCGKVKNCRTEEIAKIEIKKSSIQNRWHS